MVFLVAELTRPREELREVGPLVYDGMHAPDDDLGLRACLSALERVDVGMLTCRAHERNQAPAHLFASTSNFLGVEKNLRRRKGPSELRSGCKRDKLIHSSVIRGRVCDGERILDSSECISH